MTPIGWFAFIALPIVLAISSVLGIRLFERLRFGMATGPNAPEISTVNVQSGSTAADTAERASDRPKVEPNPVIFRQTLPTGQSEELQDVVVHDLDYIKKYNEDLIKHMLGRYRSMLDELNRGFAEKEDDVEREPKASVETSTGKPKR